MSRASASAKINLALLVGPDRPDGYHEVATVLQRIDLADDVTVEDAGAALERIGREPTARAESLAPPDFVALREALD